MVVLIGILYIVYINHTCNSILCDNSDSCQCTNIDILTFKLFLHDKKKKWLCPKCTSYSYWNLKFKPVRNCINCDNCDVCVVIPKMSWP